MTDTGRHASWLELFSDLTVVAVAIQVSHRLHDAESLGQVAVCAALFYAVWSAWTALSVYANVAGEKAGQGAVLPPWLALPVTGGMIGMAAGLGLLTAHPSAVTETNARWYLFGGLAAYLVAAVMTGPAGGRVAAVAVGFALPGLVVCVVAGIVAEPLAGRASAVIALVVMCWQWLSIRVTAVRVEGVKEAT